VLLGQFEAADAADRCADVGVQPEQRGSAVVADAVIGPPVSARRASSIAVRTLAVTSAASPRYSSVR
jgi:hypothetical protein